MDPVLDPIFKRMSEDMRLAGYAESTQGIYLCYAKLFCAHFQKSPEDMGEEEIRQYLLYQLEERKISRETYDQMRCAIRFLYSITLKRPTEIEYLPVIKKAAKLPEILSGSEVQSLLSAVVDPKYRTIIMALYAGGLRISEACQLRPEDIDSKRMIIHVRAGKGNKDRFTILSERLLLHLRDYWRRFRPKGDCDWIFPGQYRKDHVSPETVRRVFKTAVGTASISKSITPHTLRHCFATHLLEIGVDLSVIQILLGHHSLGTTQVYAHVSLEHIGQIKSPLDVLGTPAARPLR